MFCPYIEFFRSLNEALQQRKEFRALRNNTEWSEKISRGFLLVGHLEGIALGDAYLTEFDGPLFVNEDFAK